MADRAQVQTQRRVVRKAQTRRLRSGNWGVQVIKAHPELDGVPPVLKGEIVQVETKDGKTWMAAMRDVFWQDAQLAIGPAFGIHTADDQPEFEARGVQTEAKTAAVAEAQAKFGALSSEQQLEALVSGRFEGLSRQQMAAQVRAAQQQA